METKPRTIGPVIRIMPPGALSNTGTHLAILNEISTRKTRRAKSPPRIRVTSATVTDWAKMAHATVTAVRDWGNDDEIGGEIATIILERGQKCRWFNRPNFAVSGESR